MNTDQTYTIRKASRVPEVADGWNDPPWASAGIVNVEHFHPRSSDHRPITQAKVLHDARNLYVFFKVSDRYVRCVNSGYQSNVCRDSCVEFFVRPKADKGYFNFEFNCGGSLLVYYIEDPARGGSSIFRKYTPVPQELGSHLSIKSSLPSRIEPEITDPTEWSIRAILPLKLMEHFVGPLEGFDQRWDGNFFKCGDQTSHPHWASWSAIKGELNFHQPQFFAPLTLER